MRLSVRDIEINLCPVTQLCGQNVVKKHRLFADIGRFFSSEKIDDNELKNINLTMDGEAIGRKHMKCFQIDEREKLLDAIKVTKSSLLFEYITNKLNDVSFQIELFEIEKALAKIYSYLNENMQNDIGKIELDYSSSDVFEIVQKGSYTFSECETEKSNVELFQIWVNLLVQNLHNQPEKIIVLLPNFDHFVRKEEYKQAVALMYEAVEQFDISFVIGTSLHEYVDVSARSLQGICVFNDEFFQFENVEVLLTFLNRHYPYLKEWTESEIYGSLPHIIQMIGNRAYITEVQQEVILKMINETLLINDYRKKEEKSAELHFLHSKNMV